MEDWNGARWWKFDFHTHSPASYDYGRGEEQELLKQRTPREWLLDFMRAEIDCVAITDHNTGSWIDQVKEELNQMENDRPEGFRPIYLFPGVEISVHGGIHLLAILGCDKTTSDIISLLGRVGHPGGGRSSDSETSHSIIDVIGEVASAGGILIPAHVDKQKGLFSTLRGSSLSEVLDCRDVFAIEVADCDFEKPQCYYEKKLAWAEILGSDSHHPSSHYSENRYPGSHYTWVKMGTPSIEGLRLALLDGSLSVIRSDCQSETPNEFARMTLESMEVSKSRYLGRSEPFRIRFNPWLNSIIGGRGTGKSTLVEFLRIAMRREDELPEDFRDEFRKYGEVYKTRDEGGLLTDNTSLRVYYRKDDSLFRIQWDPYGNGEPIEQQTSDGEWITAQGEIPHRFPIRIYSQKQVFELANKPLSLLRIVDESPQVNRREWMERWNLAKKKFLSLRAKVRELESSVSEESRLRGDLEDIKRKQKIFEQSGYADVLRNFQKLTHQKRSIKNWKASWEDVPKRLRELADSIVPDPLEDDKFSLDSDTELQDCATQVRTSLKTFAKDINSMVLKAESVLSQWSQKLSSSSWKQTVIHAEKTYHQLKEKLVKEGQIYPDDYGVLIASQQSKEGQLKNIIDYKLQIKGLHKQIEEQLDNMISLRRELTDSRRDFLIEVLGGNPYVRINVVPYGSKETAETEIRTMLQREDESFEKDIGSPDSGGLLGKIYQGGTGSREMIETNLMDVKNDIRSIAYGNGNVPVMDQRFSKHIAKLNPESIDRLDTWFPEDSLDVQYNATGEGQRFQSIKQGSPGQKTAALLAFLLSYGDEPLILDQPEDDLDNLLIYELIVTQLRSKKRQRQLIMVTHNANIVVNGDSELVLSLIPKHGESKIGSIGCLQDKEVRETICSIMEGGRKAFEDRYHRITSNDI